MLLVQVSNWSVSKAVTAISRDKGLGFADAPEGLQVLGLRLLCRMWKSHGRGWSRLSITLLGFSPPSTRPSELCRITRAASICDVCEHDCNSGVQLVKGIQVRISRHPVLFTHSLSSHPPSRSLYDWRNRGPSLALYFIAGICTNCRADCPWIRISTL